MKAQWFVQRHLCQSRQLQPYPPSLLPSMQAERPLEQRSCRTRCEVRSQVPIPALRMRRRQLQPEGRGSVGRPDRPVWVKMVGLSARVCRCERGSCLIRSCQCERRPAEQRHEQRASADEWTVR